MDWQEYFMGFAAHAASKSKDETKVGAALIHHRSVRLCAFNGPPEGVNDLPKRRERPAKYLFAAHAEANLISFAARAGIATEGCVVFVTHHPCSSCAKALIQAGIIGVVFGPGKTSMPEEEVIAAETMFSEAGVMVEAYRSRVEPVQEAAPPDPLRDALGEALFTALDSLGAVTDPNTLLGYGATEEDIENIMDAYNTWRAR